VSIFNKLVFFMLFDSHDALNAYNGGDGFDPQLGYDIRLQSCKLGDLVQAVNTLPIKELPSNTFRDQFMVIVSDFPEDVQLINDIALQIGVDLGL